MNKNTTTKRVLQIIGYCFLGIFILIVLLITPGSPLCHSINSEVYIHIGKPIFFQDSKTITFYRQIEFVRQATGLCAFPDGGKGLVEKKYQVYSVPVGENQQPKLVSTEDQSSEIIKDMEKNAEKNLIMSTDKTKWVFYDGCEHSIEIAKNYDHWILKKYSGGPPVNQFCAKWGLNSVSDVIMTVVNKMTMDSLKPEQKYQAIK